MRATHPGTFGVQNFLFYGNNQFGVKIETQTNTDIFNIRKLLSGCKSKRFCNICPVEQIVGHFRAMMWFI